MNGFLNDPLISGILAVSIICLFILQIIFLLRVKNILQQITFYIESISRFFYRFGAASAGISREIKIPRTCQTCKYRLSFIHMTENKGEVEDFYYKCQLRNSEINLDDICEQYEKDDIY